jgi:hypothetical protein
VNVIQQSSFADWYDLDGKFSSANNYTLPFNGPYTGRTFVVPQIVIADIDGDGNWTSTSPSPSDTGDGQTLTYFNQGNTKGGTVIFNTNTHVQSPPAYLFTLLTPGSQPNSMARATSTTTA